MILTRNKAESGSTNLKVLLRMRRGPVPVRGRGLRNFSRQSRLKSCLVSVTPSIDLLRLYQISARMHTFTPINNS